MKYIKVSESWGHYYIISKDWHLQPDVWSNIIGYSQIKAKGKKAYIKKFKFLL